MVSSKKPIVSAIVAISGKNRAIGNDDKLLWHIPDDMKRFRAITIGHPIIMGRKTYESLPDKYRPLPGRTNIVVTSQRDYHSHGATVVHSLEDALDVARKLDTEELFIGGGQQIYKQALPMTDRLYLTIIDSEKKGDTFFPRYEHLFTKETHREARTYDNINYTWVTLER